jgi:acetyltransferase-like isoleucine patch superfamily enzyme
MSCREMFPIAPGDAPPGDWYHGRVPDNIEVGEGSRFDSSHCFRQYYSRLPLGLRLGRNVTLSRTSLAVEEHGYLEIGDDCWLGAASLIANRRIVIGPRCLIAGGVTISDSEFHSKSPIVRLADFVALGPRGDRAHRPEVGSAPVTIGAGVKIGWNAVVLKGVTIGDGAEVMPGAVVVRDVPAGTVAVGNPARVEESRHGA